MEIQVINGIANVISLEQTEEEKKDIILKVSYNAFKLSVEELQIKSRKRAVVVPRQISMYLLYKFTKYTVEFIGGMYKRDHTTVTHAKKVVTNLKETDKDFNSMVQFLEYKVKEKIN